MPIAEFWIAFGTTVLLVAGVGVCLLLDKRRSLWVDRRFPGTGRAPVLWGDYGATGYLEHRAHTNQRLYRLFKARKWPVGGAIQYLTPVVIVVDQRAIDFVLGDECIKIPTVRGNGEVIASWTDFEEEHYEAMLNLAMAESTNIASTVSVTGTELDVKSIVEQYTVRVLLPIFFGLQYEPSLEVAVREMLHECAPSLLWSILSTALPAMGSTMGRILDPNRLACGRLEELMFSTEREPKSGENFSSFLKRKTTQVDWTEAVSFDRNKRTLLELVRNVFYIASGTIIACLYEIASNQGVQTRLHEALQHSTDSMTDYLDNVIGETLRKYPPVHEISFSTLTSNRLPDFDVVIPRNTRVIVPTYALHRDPDHYPSPLCFDPERPALRAPHGAGKPYPSFYRPLGEKAYVNGSNFALLMVRVGLSNMLVHWRVDLAAGSPRELEVSAEGSIPYTSGKVRLMITKR
ncbi:probable cytochrome P450 6a13 [Anopheles cruzii]|uniref:probable cytochrome P450 6a13 n=1 Tax=Anopheles cruzii TaxID=68878 RepID=UPI0022EC2D11|nr:probable cytochrome P450 6a13 [Anopheles cruzii]